MTPSENSIELKGSVLDLLVWQVPNEVLNGFKVHEFEERIGISEIRFTLPTRELRGSENTTQVRINREQGSVLQSALSLVLEELGTDEFQTRTGHDFAEGCAALKQLNDLFSCNADGSRKRSEKFCGDRV